MAGEQQQERDTGQLSDAEVLAASQVGQYVFAWNDALARNQFGQVSGHCTVGGHLLLELFMRLTVKAPVSG